MNKIGNGLVFECQLSGETMVNYYHVEKRDSKYYAIAEHDSLISQMELGGWLPPGIRQATANILNVELSSTFHQVFDLVVAQGNYY